MSDAVDKIVDNIVRTYSGLDGDANRAALSGVIRQSLAQGGEAVAREYTDGRWHHGSGYLCMGTLRVARADFDTNPSAEVQAAFFDEMCAVLNAHPTPDAGRVAELEARAESFRLEGLRIIDDLSDCQIERNQAKDRIASLEAQLTESREREAKLIADLDANLEAFSDERKRALSAESLARELYELLADYVSQDSIAQGYGAGIGGTTYEKAEAFLDAIAAEKE